MQYTYKGKTIRIVPGQVWELTNPAGQKRRIRISAIRETTPYCLDRRIYGDLLSSAHRRGGSLCFARTLMRETSRLISDTPDEPPKKPCDPKQASSWWAERGHGPVKIHLPRGVSQKEVRADLERLMKTMTLAEACAEIGISEDVARVVLNGPVNGYGQRKERVA